MGNESGPKPTPVSGTPLFEVWKEYEAIAMHFNGLIMQIRIQALGGVAAISTFTGILGKGDESQKANWGLLTYVFLFLGIFWVAIWLLDLRYYTRLLLGAVEALLRLEKLSVRETVITEINMSTLIELAVDGTSFAAVSEADRQKRAHLAFGGKWFYSLVFAAILLGFLFSLYQLCQAQ